MISTRPPARWPCGQAALPSTPNILNPCPWPLFCRQNPADGHTPSLHPNPTTQGTRMIFYSPCRGPCRRGRSTLSIQPPWRNLPVHRGVSRRAAGELCRALRFKHDRVACWMCTRLEALKALQCGTLPLALVIIRSLRLRVSLMRCVPEARISMYLSA